MTVDALSAANAYRNQLKLMKTSGDGGSPDEAGQSPFAQMVENSLNSAQAAQADSEVLQTQSLTSGKVELSDLVTSIANAELSLNTVIAIRDRVINAYNDIIKMAI